MLSPPPLQLHKYEEALEVANSRRLDEDRIDSMSQRYFQVLLDTHQDERAAALKEKEGDYDQVCNDNACNDTTCNGLLRW